MATVPTFWRAEPMAALLTRLRDWAAVNITAITFLSFYFVTVVLANLIYPTRAGAWLADAAGLPTSALQFKTNFTFGFWALLLMPFVVVPLLVPLLRPILARWIVSPVVGIVPDFKRSDYLIILLGTYLLVVWALHRADAVGLSAGAANALEAIEARFTLQARLSFGDKILIHSILPLLNFYAIAAASKTRSTFWTAVSVINVTATCVVLVLINMKWPVLVFLIGIVSGIFMFSVRRPYLKAAVGFVGVVAIYLLISTYVFRFVAEPAEDFQNDPARVARYVEYTEKLGKSSVSLAPSLFSHAVNRMAFPYLYYYKIFTEEGPICGTLIQNLTPGTKPCAPTYLVYSTLFPDDGFENRGTTPAAPHITAYAMGGWGGAIIGMFGICLIISAFSALRFRDRAMTGAWAIVGATTGYHLSQIPGDGVLLYDHGVMWPVLLVIGYSAFFHSRRLVLRRAACRLGPAGAETSQGPHPQASPVGDLGSSRRAVHTSTGTGGSPTAHHHQ